MNPFGMLPVKFTNHMKGLGADNGRNAMGQEDDLHVKHCHKSASLQMHQVTLRFCFYVSGLVLAGDPCQAVLAWPMSEVDLL